MILSSRDAWRRGGSAPAWPRHLRTRSNKEETRSDISVVGRAVTCMPKVHKSVHLWTFGQVCVLSFLCVLNESVRATTGYRVTVTDTVFCGSGAFVGAGHGLLRAQV